MKSWKVIMNSFLLSGLLILLSGQSLHAQLHTTKEDSLEHERIKAHFFRIDDYRDSLEIYRSRHGHLKEMPKRLELAILVALSRYPELDSLHIRFLYGKFNMTATMRARPHYMFFLYKRWAREYLIYINNNRGRRKGMDLNDLPFNAIVGLFGHELAHIYDYTRQNTFCIIWTGISYVLSPSFKRRMEHETDTEAISRGLGPGLYQFKRILYLKYPEDSEYRERLEKYYLTPDEVREMSLEFIKE